MKRIIIIVAISIVLIALIGSIILFAIDYFTISPELKLELERKDYIDASMREIYKGDAKQIDISDIVPFEWDIVYAYRSTLNEEEFNEYSNYQIKDISMLYLEPNEGKYIGFNDEPRPFLCFVKDDEIIFVMRTHSFTLNITEKDEHFEPIFSFTPDDAVFNIIRTDGTCYLIKSKESN